METKFQRIGREQRERQEARAKRLADAHKPRRTPRQTTEQRNADRIDGFDRDDTGESPDY